MLVTRYNIATHPRLAEMHCAERRLSSTQHASARAIEKGILMPPSITIAKGEVVECEVVANKVTKIVVRRRVKDSHRDIVLVLVPQADCWKVITCWTNHRDDNHATLNKERLSA